jgi:hypothetical protein
MSLLLPGFYAIAAQLLLKSLATLVLRTQSKNMLSSVNSLGDSDMLLAKYDLQKGKMICPHHSQRGTTRTIQGSQTVHSSWLCDAKGLVPSHQICEGHM